MEGKRRTLRRQKNGRRRTYLVIISVGTKMWYLECVFFFLPLSDARSVLARLCGDVLKCFLIKVICLMVLRNVQSSAWHAGDAALTPSSTSLVYN